MGVTKKILDATNSRKNYKKNYKKKPGGELICKHFGVNGNSLEVHPIFHSAGGKCTMRLLRVPH